jgi:hypothetical protein
VERIAEQAVETEFGPFKLLAYEDHVHREVHLALVRGSIENTPAPLVRVHPIDTLSDLVGVQGVGRTWTLRDAMKRIAEVGTGIVIVLRDHSTPRELADAVSALGQRVEHAGTAPVAPQVLRTYGIGAQILKDLARDAHAGAVTPKQLQRGVLPPSDRDHGYVPTDIPAPLYSSAPMTGSNSSYRYSMQRLARGPSSRRVSTPPGGPAGSAARRAPGAEHAATR